MSSTIKFLSTKQFSVQFFCFVDQPVLSIALLFCELIWTCSIWNCSLLFDLSEFWFLICFCDRQKLLKNKTLFCHKQNKQSTMDTVNKLAFKQLHISFHCYFFFRNKNLLAPGLSTKPFTSYRCVCARVANPQWEKFGRTAKSALLHVTSKLNLAIQLGLLCTTSTS